MSGKLYVVGTPIGNLEDFSPRAIRVLSEVDFIAAEDTRVTLKLLNHFEITKELISYYEYNKNEKGSIIISRISSGESCALVSDAGMPAISDPGEELIREARVCGIEIESVPGPTAFATALAISGCFSGRFCFEGFLSVNKQARSKHLEELKNERRTMIFYEAPHKLLRTLSDMLLTFGDRNITIARELTKLHETVIKLKLSEAIKYYGTNAPKGEFVLIVDGAPFKSENEHIYTLEEAVIIAENLASDGLSVSAAAKEAAEATGIKKGEIYRKMICS